MVNSTPITATPPLLLSVSSADNSTITLHFDHDVIAGSGHFVISDGHSQSYVGANGLTTRIVGATDTRRLDDSDSQVSYSGHDVVIHLGSALQSGLSYSITMDAGTVNEAVSGAAIGRIGSTALFHFTTSGSASLPGTPAASVDAGIHFTDTGASSSDYVTSALEQTVTGSYNGAMQNGEFIQVSLDNGASWHKAIVNADLHTWSYSGVIATGNLTSGAGGNLNGTLLARVSNTDGGSSATASQAYVYSNHSIPIEVNPTASFSADSGAANDLVTNAATQTISGIYAGALQGGQTLQVSVDDGANWINATAGDGIWQVSDVTLQEGTHGLQMRVIDVAGNASSTVYNEYTLISNGAALTDRALTLATGGDTGLSASDGVISTLSSLTLNVAGLHGVHIGDVFEVIDTGNNSAVVGSYTIRDTDLYYGGGDYLSIDLHNSAPRAWLDIPVTSGLADGQHSLAVRVHDIAGNTGAASNSISLTLDTEAPAVALTGAQLQLGSAGQPVFAGGTEPVPALSNQALPSIELDLPTQPGYAVGDIIEIVDLNHGNAIVGHRTLLSGDLNSDHTLGKSNLSITLDQTLSDGLHRLAVKLADLAGNSLGLSDQQLNLTVDTTPPALQHIMPDADPGNVEPSADIVLVFSEDIELDDETIIALNGAGGTLYLSGSALSVEGHTLTIHHDPLYSRADYTVSIYSGGIHDAAGNSLPASDTPLAEFTTAPDPWVPPEPPPLLTSVFISDDHGLDQHDNITNTTPNTLNGEYTGEFSLAYSLTVQIYVGTRENHASTSLDIGPATIHEADHSWSVDVAQLLTAGSHEVKNYYVLAYVNGSESVPLTRQITIDTVAPALQHIMPDADPGNVAPSDDIVLVFSEDIKLDEETTIALNGAGDPIYLSGSALSVEGHTLTIHHDQLNYGTGYTVSIHSGGIYDAAGNSLPASDTPLAEFTTTPAPWEPPMAISMGISDDDGVSSNDLVTHTAPSTLYGAYTGEFDSVHEHLIVDIYDGTNAHVTRAAVLNPDTHTWSIEVGDLLTAGNNTVKTYYVAVYDSYYGSNYPQLTQQITIDTAPPSSLDGLAVLSLTGASAGTHTVRSDHASMALDLSSVHLAVGDLIELYDVDQHTVLDSWQVNSDALNSNGYLREPLSLSTGTLADDDYNLAVRIADVAGNVGQASDHFALTLNDALVPSMEGDNFHLAAGSDTGISASDNITRNAAALVVDLSDRLFLQAGDKIQVIEGDGVISEYTLTSMDLEELNIQSKTMSLASLNDGVHSLSVRVVDAEGRQGAASDALAVTVDTIAPDAHIVPSATTSFQYNASTLQTIYGRYAGPSDAVIEVWLNNEDGWQSASTYESSGSWYWTVTGSVSGPVIDVRIGDAAGNLAEYSDSGRDVIVIGANVDTIFDTSNGSAPIFGSIANTTYNLSEPTHNILSGGDGYGIDTVMLSFSNQTLPLSKLFGIEVIKMSPSTYTGNTIVISPADVVAMTDLYSGLHKLQIDGDASSFVDLGPGWALSNQISGYNIYTADGDSSIVLLVGSAIGTHLSA